MRPRAPAVPPRCPTCRREIPSGDNPDRPFCSERCRLLDLGSWLTESYRVPGEPVAAERDPADEDGEE